MDLRRCKGALTQVDYCPNNLPVQIVEEPQRNGNCKIQMYLKKFIEEPTGPPASNPLPVVLDTSQMNRFTKTAGSPPSILPPQLPKKELKPLPVGAPGRPQDIWSPWLGTCNVSLFYKNTNE